MEQSSSASQRALAALPATPRVRSTPVPAPIMEPSLVFHGFKDKLRRCGKKYRPEMRYKLLIYSIMEELAALIVEPSVTEGAGREDNPEFEHRSVPRGHCA